MGAASANVVKLKNRAERHTRTSVDTILISPAIVKEWANPPFQRPLRVNAKVHALAEEIKLNKGVLPGIITIGILNGVMYLLDGQHRREGFLMSGLEEGFTDVRYNYFTDMATMGEEFVKLNSSLVRLRPDDILRGLEGSSEALRLIRKRAPFVGYDMIRRSQNAPILGMSLLLRCWYGSSTDVPVAGGVSAADTARSLTVADATNCADFITIAKEAWGRDQEYVRLWGTLNLTLCMWIYRRLVLDADEATKSKPLMTQEVFKTTMMSLSADGSYLEWLVGRNMTERDRGPAYKRLKAIFKRRLAAGGKRIPLPKPSWEDYTR